MSTRSRAALPRALVKAGRKFDPWRRQHRKRTRLPKELWHEAVGLAREHGVYQTARALGVRDGSLTKHVAETAVAQPVQAKTEPDCIAFLPGMMPSGSMECAVEWTDHNGAIVRMHLKGAGAADLASLASVLRGSRT